jgi:hypothetical protein
LGEEAVLLRLLALVRLIEFSVETGEDFALLPVQGRGRPLSVPEEVIRVIEHPDSVPVAGEKDTREHDEGQNE